MTGHSEIKQVAERSLSLVRIYLHPAPADGWPSGLGRGRGGYNMEEELRMHRDHLGALVAERTAQISQEPPQYDEKELADKDHVKPV